MNKSPDEPAHHISYIPLVVDVVAHLDSVATTARTPKGIKISVRKGTTTYDTAPEIAQILGDDELAKICLSFGIHLPIEIVRHDPIASLGPIAGLTVTQALIPHCLDPAHLRA